MNKKVSILIPLYNAEDFIGETITCILNQTYPHIEIIIIDDHSKDNSFSIVQQIQNNKIKLVKNLGKGACAARNYAFKLSCGDYIQYLDADDLIDKKKIEEQIKLLEEHHNKTNNLNLVFGQWSRFYDSTANVNWEKMKINKDYDLPVNLLADCWNNGEMVPIHSWLTPRELITKAGIWNENLHHNQDGEFFSRVVALSNNILFCDESKVFYRTNVKSSISNKGYSEKHAASQLYSYQLYVKNLDKYLNNFNVKKALANNFLNFIYQFHAHYPDLSQQAEKEFNNLNVGKMWPVGGENFKKLAYFVGFKNALKLKNLIHFK